MYRAEFERGRIAERTREGLAKAREEGRVGGRRHVLNPTQRVEAIRMRDEGEKSSREIGRLFGVSHMTIRRLTA